jgi:hypothetical protein
VVREVTPDSGASEQSASEADATKEEE